MRLFFKNNLLFMTNRPNRSIQAIQEEATENSPLNNRPVSTIDNSNKFTMDAETKRILTKIAIDVILLGSVGFPVLAYFLFGVPYERGFFCDDQSLMYPFHDSTVTSAMLYSFGFGIPTICILIIEYLRWRLNMEPERELKLFGRSIPVWVINAYRFIGILLFGAACSQLITDIAKYTIGRLRPHFLSVCQPIMPDGTNCSDIINHNKYIIDFTCSNENASKRKLKEMRLSFLSGHSSFSMYTMVYAALYIHSRMEWKGSKLFKHFLQFIFIALAWYTALSRVSNYKHHWSDVMAGSIQGLFVSLLIVFGVSGLFKNKFKIVEQPKGSRYELNSHSTRSN
ncbi:hypothetical protein PVAND_008751 [Polypedilum vanderplanki]|uniref:Phosphatidic acid phosphatase type 2/haloperoxidase domain-containing protein n=1 Tax=Polypedilum vanderplanki TaxID=319348 RepID=A0A9J6CAJ7_POLVA|nr:hypothetical protein PVAND_008751 [Polypedilum vanderplanki]